VGRRPFAHVADHRAGESGWVISTPVIGARTRTRTAVAAALATGLLGLSLTACGSSGGSSDAPDYNAALKAAPPKLAKLYANGDELITGGEDAYDRTLASVRGYPVVVNNWASWCGPCRSEFPHFQQAAADHMDEVAFLGVDTDDSKGAYETFLGENPIPYPSVEDPDKQLSSWTGSTTVGLPNTFFYDSKGDLVYTHQGPYTSQDDLDADIQKYALGQSG
jgi:thiol-disulfide isomerase/thioredoxin